MSKCPVCYEQDNFNYEGKGTNLRTKEEVDIYKCNFCYTKLVDKQLLQNWEHGELESKLYLSEELSTDKNGNNNDS